MGRMDGKQAILAQRWLGTEAPRPRDRDRCSAQSGQDGNSDAGAEILGQSG